MGNKTVCSKKDEYGTPRSFFNDLDAEFNFTLDPCGWVEYPLKSNILTLDKQMGDDGLTYNWNNHRVFCNPPYSNGNLIKWIQKCFSERKNAELIVLLIPPNTDGKPFHEYIYKIADIRFIRGRLSFIDRVTKKKMTGNPQGSMLAIYRKYRPNSYDLLTLKEETGGDING